MTWRWDAEWINTLASLLLFGAAAGLQVWELWRRNGRGRRRVARLPRFVPGWLHRVVFRHDRLVWGLICWNAVIIVAYWWASGVIVGLLPDWAWARSGFRYLGIAAAVYASWVIRTAPPLVYAEEFDAMRARIAELEAEVAALRAGRA